MAGCRSSRACSLSRQARGTNNEHERHRYRHRSMRSPPTTHPKALCATQHLAVRLRDEGLVIQKNRCSLCFIVHPRLRRCKFATVAIPSQRLFEQVCAPRTRRLDVAHLLTRPSRATVPAGSPTSRLASSFTAAQTNIVDDP